MPTVLSSFTGVIFGQVRYRWCWCDFYCSVGFGTSVGLVSLSAFGVSVGFGVADGVGVTVGSALLSHIPPAAQQFPVKYHLLLAVFTIFQALCFLF